jgi:hypothetical protein
MIEEPVLEKGMPIFLAEVMATVLQVVGPKGVNFARYSIDYHILRNYLHVLQQWGPKRAKEHLPRYSWVIVQHYMATDRAFADLCSKVSSLRVV